jgi:hypothetical protein
MDPNTKPIKPAQNPQNNDVINPRTTEPAEHIANFIGCFIGLDTDLFTGNLRLSIHGQGFRSSY